MTELKHEYITTKVGDVLFMAAQTPVENTYKKVKNDKGEVVNAQEYVITIALDSSDPSIKRMSSLNAKKIDPNKLTSDGKQIVRFTSMFAPNIVDADGNTLVLPRNFNAKTDTAKAVVSAVIFKGLNGTGFRLSKIRLTEVNLSENTDSKSVAELAAIVAAEQSK